jgi:hypothetical protein
MSFQIKDFLSIVAGQLNHARAVTDKVTDWAPGSVARTIIEAPAVEIEQLYLQMFLGLRDAIPVATFQSFGFDRLPAKRAFGYASVASAAALTQPVAIPAGTVFTTDGGASYASTLDVTWAVGSTLVSVPVQADVAGSSGNISANTITGCSLFPTSSGYTIGNSLIDNGADAETDAEREARFADFVSSLSRGTITACLYAAKSATVLAGDGTIDEYVTNWGCTERPGRVSIFIYGNRGVASTALLTAAQRKLDGWRDDVTDEIVPGYRAGGVRVDAIAMSERSVAFSCRVRMLDGYTLTSAVRQQLSDIYGSTIRSVASGSTLYQGTLVDRMLAASGVVEIVPVGTANIVCAPSETLAPGVLTINSL